LENIVNALSPTRPVHFAILRIFHEGFPVVKTNYPKANLAALDFGAIRLFDLARTLHEGNFMGKEITPCIKR